MQVVGAVQLHLLTGGSFIQLPFLCTIFQVLFGLTVDLSMRP